MLNSSPFTVSRNLTFCVMGGNSGKIAAKSGKVGGKIGKGARECARLYVAILIVAIR
jgi:hypothetical protein